MRVGVFDSFPLFLPFFLFSERDKRLTRIHRVYTGHIKKATKAKVAVFTCALDIAQTETKGTVLIKNADQMLNFTSGEEKHLEAVRFLSL